MNAKTEKYYPLLLALITAVAYIIGMVEIAAFQNCYNYVIPRFKDLLSAVLNLSAILVGFLATAQSILFTIENKRAIVVLKRKSKFGTLIKYFSSAIQSSLLLALITCICILIDFSIKADWHPYFVGVWLSACTYAAACYIRLFSVFKTILLYEDN